MAKLRSKRGQSRLRSRASVKEMLAGVLIVIVLLTFIALGVVANLRRKTDRTIEEIQSHKKSPPSTANPDGHGQGGT